MIKLASVFALCTLAMAAVSGCEDAMHPETRAGDRGDPSFETGGDADKLNLLTCRKDLPPQLARDDLIEVQPTFRPAYARVERIWPTGIAADDDNGVVYFYYTDPAGTTPPDFNLLDLADPRLRNPDFRNALGVQLAATFTSWRVPGVGPPWFITFVDGNVETWFITRQQVDMVVADDVVTVPELLNLDPAPLKGFAKKFCEELRPFPGVTHFLNTFAKGRLQNGAKFKFEIHTQNLSSATQDPQIFDVRIDLHVDDEN